jgi:hypothetical protein
VSMVRLTGNFNHFDQSVEGKAAMQAHVRAVSAYWPNYSSIFADMRVNILIGAKVVMDKFPGIMDGFPKLTNVTKSVLLTTLPILILSKGDVEASIPEDYTTEAFWKAVQCKVDALDREKFAAINLEAERKRNPGKFKINGEWVEYGSVYHNAEGLEMVVLNHTTMPMAQFTAKAQFIENTMAVMPLTEIQPAIDLINSLGGTMFAAVCRAGFALIEQAVNTCANKKTGADLISEEPKEEV